MRKATGYFWDKTMKKNLLVAGFFHCWASRCIEFESGGVSQTVALIEDDIGQIRECEPDTVRFLN